MNIDGELVMVISVVVLVIVALCRLQVVHIRRVREDRGSLFDAVAGLFDNVRVHQDGLNFPVLTGAYRGHPIRLEPVVDTVAFRKLPVLWLVLQQQRELSVGAPVDILLRPMGTEFFSPNNDFGQERRAVQGFPADARIASPDWRNAPPLTMFAPHQRFLSDPRAKELYVTEHGVRLVWRLAEGSQTHYRTTRRADLGSVRVLPAELLPVLNTLRGVGDTLSRQVERSTR